MEENSQTETKEQARRRKISETKKRKYANEPHHLKGRPKSEDHKRAIGAANFGKRRTVEQRASMGDARKAVGFSDEFRMSMAERMRANTFRNLPKTEEHKRKIRESRTGISPQLRKYGIEAEEYKRQLADGNKWCSQGKHFSPIGNFQNRRNFCQDCKSAHHRARHLEGKYGVTSEWYDQKLASQGGGCAMCGSTELPKGWNFLAIDHDHSPGGKPRGILCQTCNTGLGVIESPGFIQRAAVYLAQYGTTLRVEEIPMSVPETEQP